MGALTGKARGVLAVLFGRASCLLFLLQAVLSFISVLFICVCRLVLILNIKLLGYWRCDSVSIRVHKH